MSLSTAYTQQVSRARSDSYFLDRLLSRPQSREKLWNETKFPLHEKILDKGVEGHDFVWACIVLSSEIRAVF